MYWEAWCTVKKEGGKVKGWGFVIEADTAEEALEEAVRRGKTKAEKKYSRYKGAEIGPGEVKPF